MCNIIIWPYGNATPFTCDIIMVARHQAGVKHILSLIIIVYFQFIFMFTLSISVAPFEVLPLCFCQPHCSRNYYIFPFICWFRHGDNQCRTVWSITIVFLSAPLFKKLLYFSIYLLIPAWGQSVTIKTSQGEFLSWKNFINSETTYLTQQRLFSGKKHVPKWSPLARVVQPKIAGKSWNHRSLYWAWNLVDWKPCISHQVWDDNSWKFSCIILVTTKCC